MPNETWHIEPTLKYGKHLIHAGPSIIYNALDVDMTKYNSTNAFRSKRFAINEDDESASFCGLNKNENREKMAKETKRLTKDEYEESDFKARYTRTRRQTMRNNERERTCCYIYIRVDPTLWDVVYKNEGLNVRFVLSSFVYKHVYREFSSYPLLGKRTNYSCNCHIPLSNSNSSKCYLSFIEI